MYCTKCGVEMDASARYCAQCGMATPNTKAETAAGPNRRLMRSRYDGKIAGVCAGFANYLDVDVTMVRLVWLVLTFCPPSIGLIAYIVAWIVMPKEPERITGAVYQA